MTERRSRTPAPSLESSAFHLPFDLLPITDARAVDESTDSTCRICLESETSDNLLLHPCKCAGTVRHVHEDCLKAWLSSREQDLALAQCELCKTPFVMNVKLRRRCAPKGFLNEGFTHCLLAPLLAGVLGMVGLIIYLLADKYLVNASSSSQRGYSSALIGVCLLASLVLIYLLFKALREAFCSRYIQEWTIQNHDLPEQDSVPNSKTDSVLEPSQVEMRPEGSEPMQPPILVIPKRVKFGGMRVRTPEIHTGSLTPVIRRGRIVAVTPRLFAYPASLSQSRASFSPSPLSHQHSGFLWPAAPTAKVQPMPVVRSLTPEATLTNVALRLFSLQSHTETEELAP